MTRENKLSIVIAFGLLIFVGMLVADHFSIASQREIANLGSNIASPPLFITGDLKDNQETAYAYQTITNTAGDQMHTVQNGDTLRTICTLYYGDSGLAAAVAQWNALSNPNAIELGQQIAIPTRTALIALSFENTRIQMPIEIASNQTISLSMGSYTVQKGDTLSEIAQKVMGTTKKTQLLIDVNKKVMPNPDRIRPGMVLQYPTNP